MLYSNAMRTGLAFFLAIMLSLNAAYAASMGICDALEHSSSHSAHFGHHSHGHGDDHARDDPVADADGASDAPAASDHHHAHVHPVFSSLPTASVCITLLAGCGILFENPGSTFISAPQAPLDRPPRATLA